MGQDNDVLIITGLFDGNDVERERICFLMKIEFLIVKPVSPGHLDSWLSNKLRTILHQTLQNVF